MTTIGELRAIMEELELVDIGDAASYLGEEAVALEEAPGTGSVLTVVDKCEHLSAEEYRSFRLHF